jgi:hypothetical protein
MTRQILAGFFDEVKVEYGITIDKVTGYFDLFGRRGNLQIAFEVETTIRHVVDNANKASAAGVLLWIIVPERRLRNDARRLLEPLSLKPGGEPIKILLLGELRQELKSYLS